MSEGGLAHLLFSCRPCYRTGSGLSCKSSLWFVHTTSRYFAVWILGRSQRPLMGVSRSQRLGFTPACKKLLCVSSTVSGVSEKHFSNRQPSDSLVQRRRVSVQPPDRKSRLPQQAGRRSQERLFIYCAFHRTKSCFFSPRMEAMEAGGVGGEVGGLSRLNEHAGGESKRRGVCFFEKGQGGLFLLPADRPSDSGIKETTNMTHRPFKRRLTSCSFLYPPTTLPPCRSGAFSQMTIGGGEQRKRWRLAKKLLEKLLRNRV